MMLSDVSLTPLCNMRLCDSKVGFMRANRRRANTFPAAESSAL